MTRRARACIELRTPLDENTAIRSGDEQVLFRGVLERRRGDKGYPRPARTQAVRAAAASALHGGRGGKPDGLLYVRQQRAAIVELWCNTQVREAGRELEVPRRLYGDGGEGEVLLSSALQKTQSMVSVYVCV